MVDCKYDWAPVLARIKQASMGPAGVAEWDTAEIFDVIRVALSQNFVQIVGKPATEFPTEAVIPDKKARAAGARVTETIHSVFADLDEYLAQNIADLDLLYDCKSATKVVKLFFTREHLTPAQILEANTSSFAVAINKLFQQVISYFSTEYNIPAAEATQLVREAMKERNVRPIEAIRRAVLPEMKIIIECMYDALASQRSLDEEDN